MPITHVVDDAVLVVEASVSEIAGRKPEISSRLRGVEVPMPTRPAAVRRMLSASVPAFLFMKVMSPEIAFAVCEVFTPTIFEEDCVTPFASVVRNDTSSKFFGVASLLVTATIALLASTMLVPESAPEISRRLEGAVVPIPMLPAWVR